MLYSLLALSLLHSAAQADPQQAQAWQVADTDGACIAHAAWQGGTVVTVFALPDHAGIGFLLQNVAWTDLQDGAVYPLDIRFENGSSWSLEAVARREIDEDGPGLFFAVRPGAGENGRDFMAEFAEAQRMRIGHRGAAVQTLALSGTRDATEALAECLSRLIGGRSPFGDGEGERPVRI